MFIENQLKSYFLDKSYIIAVMLYGSYAFGNEKTESDVDIAVLKNNESLTPEEKTKMMIDLMKLLDKNIDLVSFGDAPCVLQMQILKNGKLIICRDEKAYFQFQVRVIQEYLDLKKIRKPIEEELKNVSIYG